MAVMDEFKEERAALKGAPFKQKVAYFWEYYKWHAIIPLVIIVALSSYIYHMATKPEELLNGIFLNTHVVDAQTLSDTLAEDFCKENKINTKKYAVDLNASLSLDGDNMSSGENYETIQVLMTWVGAGTVDFISGDLTSMTELAYRSYYIDLRDLFNEEELAKYEPYFLYIDQAVLDEKNDMTDLADTSVISYPDCTKPEEMEKPIPVLIDISQNEKLIDIYADDESLVLGIAANTKNKDTLLHFLDYLTE